MNMKAPRNSRHQRGLAMVEATIVLPLFLLLALGGAEFGRMLEQYNVINKQQQDGARYISGRAKAGTTGLVGLDFNAPDGNAYEAQNLVVYGNTAGAGDPVLVGLSPDDVTITALPGHVQVTVEYGYTPIFAGVVSMLLYGNDSSLNFPLRSSVVMRVVG